MDASLQCKALKETNVILQDMGSTSMKQTLEYLMELILVTEEKPLLRRVESVLESYDKIYNKLNSFKLIECACE